MKTYHGGCHCGRVRFSVTTRMDKIVSCNCSICSRKGVLHHRVTKEQFNLLQGKEWLSLYQFGTEKAKHFFCRECGIHPFSNPRAAPDTYSINVRCLDDFDLELEEYELVTFDGRHWEEAVTELNEQLRSDK